MANSTIDFQLISSYIASVTLSSKLLKSIKPSLNASTQRVTCYLDKYKVTQQIYFKCSNALHKPPPQSLNTKIVFDCDSSHQETIFMLFEDVSLFGRLGNASFVDLNAHTKLIDLTGLSETKSETSLCSQVAALMLPNMTGGFNLTVEIKLPANYYALLSGIEAKLRQRAERLDAEIRNKTLNATLLNEPGLAYRLSKLANLVEQVTNPFEQIFQTESPLLQRRQIDEESLNFKKMNYSNELAMSQLADELSERDLTDSVKLHELRKSLLTRWYLPSSYQVVYAHLDIEFKSDLSEWSTVSQGRVKCELDTIQQMFRPYTANSVNETSTTRSANTYRLFANLKCGIADNSSELIRVHFVTLEQVAVNRSNNVMLSEPFQQTIDMIDEYAAVFKLDLAGSDPHLSWMQRLRLILRHSYEIFDHKIVYFASISSCFLLLGSMGVYALLARRLQMPRSFCHIFINIWACNFFLLAVYTLGIRQVHLPHMCLVTAVIIHYLSLCICLWYTLYFYSLFAKLRGLKERNFNLIFVQEVKTKPIAKDYDEDEEEDEETIQKPVVHLYMFGWGLPMLLCAIVVSITKRAYLTAPYDV